MENGRSIATEGPVNEILEGAVEGNQPKDLIVHQPLQVDMRLRGQHHDTGYPKYYAGSEGASNLNHPSSRPRGYDSVIRDNSLEGEGEQINGVDIEGPGDTLCPDHSDMCFTNNYTSPASKGNQINGTNICEIEGPNCIKERPANPVYLTGSYVKNRHSGTGKQVNGIRITRKY